MEERFRLLLRCGTVVLLLLLLLPALLIGLLPQGRLLLRLGYFYPDGTMGAVLKQRTQGAGVISQQFGRLRVFCPQHHMERTIRRAGELRLHSPQMLRRKPDLQMLRAVFQPPGQILFQSLLQLRGRGSGIHRFTDLDRYVFRLGKHAGLSSGSKLRHLEGRVLPGAVPVILPLLESRGVFLLLCRGNDALHLPLLG